MPMAFSFIHREGRRYVYTECLRSSCCYKRARRASRRRDEPFIFLSIDRTRRFFIYSYCTCIFSRSLELAFTPRCMLNVVSTRSPATADGPRDAMCLSEFCQILLHDSVGTSCTTNIPLLCPNFLITQFRIGRRKLPCQNQLYPSSRFDTVAACDGQTDGQTDTIMTTAYTALA